MQTGIPMCKLSFLLLISLLFKTISGLVVFQYSGACPSYLNFLLFKPNFIEINRVLV
uniref:Uncharacterized protein n=1 Tax=Anguilla anguilla TaxID=7936 RepID=A0A0E9RCI8_ANGAN